MLIGMTDFSIFIFCFIFCDFNHKISNKFNCYALRKMGPDQPQHSIFASRFVHNRMDFGFGNADEITQSKSFLFRTFCVCVLQKTRFYFIRTDEKRRYSFGFGGRNHLIESDFSGAKSNECNKFSPTAAAAMATGYHWNQPKRMAYSNVHPSLTSFRTIYSVAMIICYSDHRPCCCCCCHCCPSRW